MSKGGATRILLADDHALVRRGVRLILENEPDLTVVAEAGNGAEAIELAKAERPDLAILDIAMPRLTGLQAARARGRTGSRPPALKPKDIAAAKALLRDPEITVVEVARRLGVVPSTFY